MAAAPYFQPLKLIFRIGGIFKILFILNIFLIEWYRDSLRSAEKRYFFDFIELDNLHIEISWYVYLFAIILSISYAMNLVVINLFAFKPCWKLSKYFQQLNWSRLVYAMEIILLIGAIILGYNEFDEAYSHTDIGIWDELLKPLFDQSKSESLRLIGKLEALNFIITALSSLIVLTLFWRMRNLNIRNCP
jgi:hypothetical protein